MSPPRSLREWMLALIPRSLARIDMLTSGNAAEVFADPLALIHPKPGELVVPTTVVTAPVKPLRTEEAPAAADAINCRLLETRSELVRLERSPEPMDFSDLDVIASASTTSEASRGISGCSTPTGMSRRCSSTCSLQSPSTSAAAQRDPRLTRSSAELQPKQISGCSTPTGTSRRCSSASSLHPPSTSAAARRDLRLTRSSAELQPKRSRGRVRTMSDPHSPQSVDGLFAQLQVRRPIHAVLAPFLRWPFSIETASQLSVNDGGEIASHEKHVTEILDAAGRVCVCVCVLQVKMPSPRPRWEFSPTTRSHMWPNRCAPPNHCWDHMPWSKSGTQPCMVRTRHCLHRPSPQPRARAS
jgi:hypothetical protein